MARKIKTTDQEALNLTGKTALYVRVSTVRQAEEGYSLEAQRSKLEKHSEAQGWTVDPEHVYVDAGISGKSVDRPAYQAMLHAVATGAVCRVVAVKMDRFSRSVRDFLQLLDFCEEHDCAVVSLGESIDTSTPIGRMMVVVISAIAEMEKETIKERLMSGRAQKAQEGGHAGGAIEFGYTYAAGDEWKIDDTQADTVRRIFELFLAGNGLRRIADIVNQEGRPTGTGARWHASTVGYVLRNGAYCGYTQWDGIESKHGKMPAIISADDYEAAQTRLSTLRRGNPGKAAAEEA